MGRQRIIIVVIVLFFLLLGMIASVYFFNDKENVVQQENCLTDDEAVSYEIKERKRVLGDAIADVNVNVIDKKTKLAVNTFQINDVFKTSTSIESHRCGIYVIRFLNYDPQKTKQDPGFKVELWKYQHNGQGNNLLILAEKDQRGVFKGDYSYAFRIDPTEKYLVLEKGYLGKEDYALIVKNINTKQDVFALSSKSVTERYPDRIGSFNMCEWTKDSRYFWGDIFDGAYVLVYFRIDTSSWKTEMFEAPDGAMGGMPLNINTGYVPIQPGLVWTGDAELTQELKEKERKEGKESSLYLYNLLTKEKTLIETTGESQFFFKPKWVSDTELEYELPNGEKKIYKLED